MSAGGVKGRTLEGGGEGSGGKGQSGKETGKEGQEKLPKSGWEGNF